MIITTPEQRWDQLEKIQMEILQAEFITEEYQNRKSFSMIRSYFFHFETCVRR